MENNRACLDHIPGFVARSFLDHAKALENATCSAVSWIVCGKGNEWLDENGVFLRTKAEMPDGDSQYVPSSHINEQQLTFFEISGAFASEFNEHLGYPIQGISRRDLLTAYERDSEGIGGQRAGEFTAGCYFQNDVADFVVASSFVRLLGAWEQFEIDVLRCLMYHRPNGMLGTPTDNEMIILDEQRYKTEFSDEGDSGGIWSWLGKTAENRTERARILKNVYGLPRDCGLKGSAKSKFHTRVSEWYDTRNRIAHGRGNASVSLGDYVDADATIFDRVMQLSLECKEKQLVWL